MKAIVRPLAILALCSGASFAESLPDASTIISTVIRREGYRCDKPMTAHHDDVDSIPDETAWILTCKNATYRVRLLPHSFSPVEILSSKD